MPIADCRLPVRSRLLVQAEDASAGLAKWEGNGSWPRHEAVRSRQPVRACSSSVERRPPKPRQRGFNSFLARHLPIWTHNRRSLASEVLAAGLGHAAPELILASDRYVLACRPCRLAGARSCCRWDDGDASRHGNGKLLRPRALCGGQAFEPFGKLVELPVPGKTPPPFSRSASDCAKVARGGFVHGCDGSIEAQRLGLGGETSGSERRSRTTRGAAARCRTLWTYRPARNAVRSIAAQGNEVRHLPGLDAVALSHLGGPMRAISPARTAVGWPCAQRPAGRRRGPPWPPRPAATRSSRAAAAARKSSAS